MDNEPDQSKINKNLNRFSFNGYINGLKSNSLVVYLLNNTIMSLRDAFEICNYNWEEGLANSTMLFIITYDFEGEIFIKNIDPALGTIDFKTSVNYLIIDKLTMKADEQKKIIFELVTHYKKQEFNDILVAIQRLLQCQKPLSRDLHFQILFLKAETLMNLGKFKQSNKAIIQAEHILNTLFTEFEKEELSNKKQIREENDKIIYWDNNILCHDFKELTHLKKIVDNLFSKKINN